MGDLYALTLELPNFQWLAFVKIIKLTGNFVVVAGRGLTSIVFRRGTTKELGFSFFFVCPTVSNTNEFMSGKRIQRTNKFRELRQDSLEAMLDIFGLAALIFFCLKALGKI